jgi:hypothetical protein
MNSKLMNRIGIFAALIFGIISLYVYARFTVDDAFITWRYGKNLISYGIWNYNPSLLDLTQAYTNPVFALLGIIPAAFGWDVVLFFKLVSVFTYISLFIWMVKISGRNWLMVLLFLGLPATVVHTFSGLETMIYVFLVAALLVALHQKRFFLTIGLGLLLFVTRPESWILVCVLPAYWYFVEPVGQDCLLKEVGPAKRTLICLAILGLSLVTYFALHVFLFGNALPNTFYAKSGANFRPMFALNLFLYMLPLLLAFRRSTWQLVGVSVILFGGMIISYSSSDLQMNYSQRFAFHIFGPCYIFGLYLSAFKLNEDKVVDKEASRERYSIVARIKDYASSGTALTSVLVFLLVKFFLNSGKWPAYEATYYQRALNAHAVLGKKIKQIAAKYEIRALSIGDAGMLPYHSDICVLDNVGLASSKLTRGKPTDELFESYGLDMVILFTKNGSPDTSIYRQEQLLGWVEKRGMVKVGDLYWQPDYILSIYAKCKMPEIEEVCSNSRLVNTVPDTEFRRVSLPVPPWTYWHE